VDFDNYEQAAPVSTLETAFQIILLEYSEIIEKNQTPPIIISQHQESDLGLSIAKKKSSNLGSVANSNGIMVSHTSHSEINPPFLRISNQYMRESVPHYAQGVRQSNLGLLGRMGTELEFGSVHPEPLPANPLGRYLSKIRQQK
jgi:hypothetical protein